MSIGNQNMETNEKLINAILAYLEIGGTEGQSISFLQTSLRQDGWRGLGSNLSQFEDLLESLGFKLVRIQTRNSPNIRRTNVTV